MTHYLYPGTLVMILVFVMLFIFIFKNGLTFEGMIAASNTLSSQPMALIVLVIGCVMMKISKDIGADSNIAAGVIGCALGLLNNQFSRQHTETTSGNSATTSDSGTPQPIPPQEPPAPPPNRI